MLQCLEEQKKFWIKINIITHPHTQPPLLFLLLLADRAQWKPFAWLSHCRRRRRRRRYLRRLHQTVRNPGLGLRAKRVLPLGTAQPNAASVRTPTAEAAHPGAVPVLHLRPDDQRNGLAHRPINAERVHRSRLDVPVERLQQLRPVLDPEHPRQHAVVLMENNDHITTSSYNNSNSPIGNAGTLPRSSGAFPNVSRAGASSARTNWRCKRCPSRSTAAPVSRCTSGTRRQRVELRWEVGRPSLHKLHEISIFRGSPQRTPSGLWPKPCVGGSEDKSQLKMKSLE